RLGLEVFELQPEPARQLLVQEILILGGLAVAGARQDAGERFGRLGIVVQRLEMLARQRALAFVGRGLGHRSRIIRGRPAVADVFEAWMIVQCWRSCADGSADGSVARGWQRSRAALAAEPGA